jgi:hypothetical protein
MDQGTDIALPRYATVERIPMTEHARFNGADGMATLGICEALLIALTELKIISEQDARDLLTDVVAAHSDAADASQTPERHRAVAAIVQRILDGKDGMRQ